MNRIDAAVRQKPGFLKWDLINTQGEAVDD
jgi:hypothetical protein